jgi:hypothetical protein
MDRLLGAEMLENNSQLSSNPNDKTDHIGFSQDPTGYSDSSAENEDVRSLVAKLSYHRANRAYEGKDRRAANRCHKYRDEIVLMGISANKLGRKSPMKE